MFGLVAALLECFSVTVFWAALFGWLIVSLTAWLAAAFVAPKGR
jgi:hypothetical protein